MSMKTKIVYVTTCNESNFYLEQVLMSAYSARLHNPDATILLVTDVDSEKTIVGKRETIRQYVNDVLAFDCPKGYNNMMKSRYLKTNLRNLIDGDMLYVDSDTVICGPLDDIDKIEDDVCGIRNRHTLFNRNNNKSTYKLFSKCDYDFEDEFVYINGGVLLAKDSDVARNLYGEWFKEWKYTLSKGCPMDMMSLHKAELNVGYKIKEIPGEWNCQIEGACLNYLKDAKILHYFAMGSRDATTSYKLRELCVYERIKEMGNIPDDILFFLHNPHKAFTENHLIIAGQTLQFMKDSEGIQKLNKYFPRLSRSLLSFFDRLAQSCSSFVGEKTRSRKV